MIEGNTSNAVGLIPGKVLQEKYDQAYDMLVLMAPVDAQLNIEKLDLESKPTHMRKSSFVSHTQRSTGPW